MKLKRIFGVAVALLVVGAVSAKNVVPVHTSCGKTAYIDTERTSIENTMAQIEAINRVLCDE